MMSHRWLVVGLALCALPAIRFVVDPRMRTDSLDIAGDSQGYHLLAVNLLNGLGYCPHPVAGHEYDEFTTSLVNLAPEPARFEPLRVPGYPLALAGIYQLFGVSSLTILRYQQLLAGFSAMALGVGAWRLAGWRGLVAAAASVFLLSTNAEGSYSISMLLSECQTESLMALSFALSAMSDRVPGTHTLCGLAIASAVLTRPGCLCIAAVYFAFLIHHRVPGRWRQIVSFGLVVGLWSAIATYQSGRPVVLTSNTGTVVCAGIDPRRAATEIGVTAPELSAESLEKFWRGWPGGTSESPLQYLIEILRDSPREFGLLQILKIKIAMRAIPPVMWCFALLALVSGVHRQTRVWLTEALTGIAAAAVLWNAYKLVTALCAGTVVAFSDRSARGKSGPECYLAGVVYGYLLMCVVSIAHIRFGRPVLAEFYFLAATGCLTIFFPPSSSPSKFSVREAKL